MMKYWELSPAQKRMIQAKIKSHHLREKDITSRNLVEWCKKTFNLSSVSCKCTITWLINRTLSKMENETISKVVHSRIGAHPNLEAAFLAWICDQANHWRMIHGLLITAKARRLQLLWNDKLLHDKNMNLSFSGGWLTKFKRVWVLKHFMCHGDSGNADRNAAEEAMPHFRENETPTTGAMSMMGTNTGCFTILPPTVQLLYNTHRVEKRWGNCNGLLQLRWNRQASALLYWNNA